MNEEVRRQIAAIVRDAIIAPYPTLTKRVRITVDAIAAAVDAATPDPVDSRGEPA